MIALYILGGVVLLSALIGSVRLSVRVGFTQMPLLELGLGCFRLNLTDKNRQKTTRRPKKAKAKPTETGESPKKPKKQKKKKQPVGPPPSLTEVLTAFRDLITGVLKQTARHWKIEMLRLRVLVATDDAAKTALLYGTVCALVQPVQLFVHAAPRVSHKNVRVGVECDFLAEKPELDLELYVSTRLWRLTWIAIRQAKPLIDAIRLLKAWTGRKEYKAKDGQTPQQQP